MIADFLQFEFLRNTLYTGLLIGLIAPLLGCFIVVRRLSLIADALSHVTLAGIAFGLLMEKKLATPVISPFYAGLGFSVVASLLIEKLRSMFRNFQEIAIPIILSGGVGLSVIFISLANGFTTDLFSYLFGSVSAVSSDDLQVIIIISIIVLLVIGVLYKQLLVLSFDEEHARVSGLHAKVIHFIFMLLTALVIAASIRIVGVLLVSALMTIPVAAAIRLAKGFKQAMILAILFGETSVIVGLFSGYYFEIPPGGTIVVVSILILLLSFIVQKLLLANKRKTAFEKGGS